MEHFTLFNYVFGNKSAEKVNHCSTP